MRKKLLILALVLTACDTDGAGPDDEPRIQLAAQSITVGVGSTTTVGVTITNAAELPTFVSRDNTVAQATLGAGIAITGVQAGSTYVVVWLPSFPQVRDSVHVVVTATNNPGQPVQLPLLGTGVVQDRFTAEVAVSGDIAYTSTWGFRTVGNLGYPGNVIKVWNVAANTPQLIDSLVIANISTIGDVQISDDGALLVAALEGGSTNNGIAIYSRTNPARPVLIHRFSHQNTSPGVHTLKLGRINNRLYAFLSVNDGRLMILDLNDPANPQVTFNQVIANSIHDVFIRDGVLFAALWHTGLRIYDVGGAGSGGTPASPVALGTVVTKLCTDCSGGPSVHNVWWFHNPIGSSKRYAFVGEEGFGNWSAQVSSGAIHVVDVTNFNTPVEVAVYEPDMSTTANAQIAGTHNFVMDEASGILYAGHYNAGVRALDVRGDLGTCTAAQKTADGRCNLRLMGREAGIAVSSGPPKYVWGVARVGSHLYASDMWNGLFKIDITALQR